jgi:hypothetical protein
VDKIIIKRHPSKIDKDGKRHYLIRAIHQDPQQRLSDSRRCTRRGSRSSPGSEHTINRFRAKRFWATGPILGPGPGLARARVLITGTLVPRNRCLSRFL